MDAERNRSSDTDGAVAAQQHGITVSIPVPAINDRIYRYTPTDQILQVLADDPSADHTFRELSRRLDRSHSSIKDAVDVLHANDLVHVEAEGNRKRVSINTERLAKPRDPILSVPQTEFHAPLRAVVDRIHEELTAVKGIVVFGSVARGQADRRSDIDLWVLVQNERATNQQKANEVAKELGQQRFDGHRYEFQVLVESVESALQYGDRLADVIETGLTIYRTETLQRVISAVVDDATR